MVSSTYSNIVWCICFPNTSRLCGVDSCLDACGLGTVLGTSSVQIRRTYKVRRFDNVR